MLKSLQFQGIYGVQASSTSAVPSAKYYDVNDVKKALTEKAEKSGVKISFEVASSDGGSNLPRGKRQAISPVGTESNPMFDDRLIVFTQEDASTHGLYLKDVEQFRKREKPYINFAESAFNKTHDLIGKASSKLGNRFGEFVYKSYVLLSAPLVAIVQGVESSGDRRGSNQVVHKWENFLNRIPVTSKLLAKDAVLTAVAQDKFDVAAGKIAP
ncbi:MAG: hypothetical protein K2X66_15405 [Cyanobacteria bacterium]|nr:hypothetical protein [Cyanobacteriota bacterium]